MQVVIGVCWRQHGLDWDQERRQGRLHVSNKIENCLSSAQEAPRVAIYALHALGASRIYLFNRTRGGGRTRPCDPDANVELLDTLDVTSVQVRASVIVSTVPGLRRRRHETEEEHVPEDALYLPSSLFSADAGVRVDMPTSPRRRRC